MRGLYAATARPLWSVCLAWVILSCFYGGGGWVNELLSWKGWIPLSRLTYTSYLLHIMISELIGFNRDHRLHFNGHFEHV